MTTTIISVSQTEADTVSILVDSAYTNSLHKLLKDKKISCTQPSAAIFRTRRVYLDEDGKKHIEQDVLVNEISASGTVEEFEKWIDDWDVSTV